MTSVPQERGSAHWTDTNIKVAKNSTMISLQNPALCMSPTNMLFALLGDMMAGFYVMPRMTK